MRFVSVPRLLARYRWALLVWLLLNSALDAQPLRSRTLSLAQGLPEYFVSGLAQDRTGFVWIATRDGLARYDGQHFKVFRHQPGDPRSLAGNVLLGLQTVSDSALLIRLEDHTLQLFNPLTETFSPLLTKQRLDQFHLRITQVLLSPDQEQCWGRWERQLVHYQPRQHRITRYALPPLPLAPEAYPGNTLCFDAQGQRLYLPYPGGLLAFHPTTHRARLWPCPALGQQATIPTFYGLPLARRHNGELMMGGARQLILFDPPTHRFRTLPIPDSLATNVGLIYPAPDGQVYFTYGMTLYRLGPDDRITPLWQAGRLDYHNYFQALLLDRNGVLWVGTNGDGLQQIDLRALPIQTAPYQRGFLEDVLRLELQGALPAELQPPHVLDYFRWQAPYLSGYLRGNIRLWRRQEPGPELVAQFARRLPHWPDIHGEDHGQRPRTGGGRWLYFPAQGLLELDTAGRLLRTFPLHLDRVRDIQPRGRWLWLATELDGLYGYDLQRRRLRVHLRHQENQPGSLLTDQLTCLAVDPLDSSRLWVGSMEGLSRLDTRTGLSRHWTRQQGLPSATINTLLTDGQGQLWFSTLRGISRLNPRTGGLRHYSVEDGLLDIEYRPQGSARLSDGRFAFAGDRGLTLFNPRAMKEVSEPVPVALTGLRIGNVPIEVGSTGSPLTQPLNQTRSVRLEHNQNFISIEFAGLQYNHPTQLRYRYHLEGVDAGWVEAGSTPVAHYTQLAPGCYCFRVQASTAGGLWGPRVKSVQIVIAPPRWGTPGAYGLYGVLVGGLLYAYLRFRRQRARLRGAVALHQQEAQQAQALSALRDRFFANLTHEFRTPLTLILGPLERLKQRVDGPEGRWLNTIEQNAQRLLGLINQLLELAKLDAHQLGLQPERASPSLTVSQLLAGFAEQAALQGIQVAYQQALKPVDYWFDVDKFVQISTNLMANALKWTPQGGRIEVALSEQPPHIGMAREAEDGIYLTVSDTGLGIPAQALPFVFERFYQVASEDSGHPKAERMADGGTGIGLALVKELVERQGGWVSVRSRQPNLKPWSTQFAVWLPYQPAPVLPEEPVLEEDVHIEPLTPVVEKLAPQVLIVEDHPELAHFIAQCLPAHYRISQASDGQEGLRRAVAHLPDLVIADIMMPVLDGLSMCEQLKADRSTSHIPLLLLTAKVGRSQQLAGLERGADDYLTKPFHPQELRLRVGNLLIQQQRLRAWLRQQLTQPAPPAEPVPAPLDPFLARLEEVLADCLGQPNYSVEQLAGTLGVSYRTLHRKLAMLTGMTAVELVRAYRLRQAAQWLSQGQPVSEVAFRVGFESLSYFAKCFKGQFGRSPSAYAAQQTVNKRT